VLKAVENPIPGPTVGMYNWQMKGGGLLINLYVSCWWNRKLANQHPLLLCCSWNRRVCPLFEVLGITLIAEETKSMKDVQDRDSFWSKDWRHPTPLIDSLGATILILSLTRTEKWEFLKLQFSQLTENITRS
jgi:hypothetical protein